MSKYLYIREFTLNKIISICRLKRKGIDFFKTIVETSVVCFTSNKSLNTGDMKYISHNTEGELFIKDINKPKDESKKVKLGKVLQQLSSNKLKPEEIEDMLSKWKKAYTIDTSVVEVSEDIGAIYDISECGGSCMAHHGEFMEIYKYFGCKIAYITDEHGSLMARALLWHNINYFKTLTELQNSDISKGNFIDRIFYTKEKDKLTIQKWAEENGYRTFDNENVNYYTDPKPLESFRENGVPYIDTLHEVGVIDDTMLLSNGNSLKADWWCTFQCTNGTSEDGEFGLELDLVYAEDLGEYIDREEVIYIENGDYYVSEDYEHIAYIESWGYYVDTCEDDSVVYAEDLHEYIPLDEAYFAVDTEMYYADDSELYFCEDDGNYYEDTDDICYTEDDETYRLKDNCYCVAETGEWFYDVDNYTERLKELNDEKL